MELWLRHVKTTALMVLFTFLCFYVPVNRSASIFTSISTKIPSNQTASWKSEFDENANICGHFPACLRITGAIVGESIDKLAEASEIFFPLEDHPSIYDSQNHNLTRAAKKHLLSSLTSILFRYVMLLPLILVVRALEQSLLNQLLLLGTLSAPLIGWGRTSLNHVFDVSFNHYDYPDLAFLALAFAGLTRLSKPVSIQKQTKVYLLGQLCFENLGMVPSLLLIAPSLARRSRTSTKAKMRFAISRLFHFGAFCLIFTATVGTLFALKHDVHSLPQLQKSAALSLSICAAFIISFIIGFFNSGLHDEMDRQLICL